jgi:hypothetical protein
MIQTKVAGTLTEEKILSLSNVELAAVYTELTGKRVRRFANLRAGRVKVREAMEQLEARRAAQSPRETPTHRRRKRFDLPPRRKLWKWRKGTLRDRLISLLLEGATFEECMEVGHWDYTNTYNNIRMLHQMVGFGVREDDKGVIQIFTSQTSGEAVE